MALTEGNRHTGTDLVKRGLAEMLRGGVIMDVVDAEQARIAEDSGAVRAGAWAERCRGTGGGDLRCRPTAGGGPVHGPDTLEG